MQISSRPTRKLLAVLAAVLAAGVAAVTLFLGSAQQQQPATVLGAQDALPSELTGPVGPNDQDALGPLGQSSVWVTISDASDSATGVSPAELTLGGA